MAVSLYEKRREIEKEAHRRRESARLERDRRTVEISAAWKNGFIALKDENDRMQRERDLKFRSEMAEINAWVLDMKVGLQR
jgi:hypothetical protein